MVSDATDDEVFALRDQKFEWNRRKAQANKEHHKVTFRVAASVFFDSYAVYGTDDREDYDEDREWIIGMPPERPQLLHVVYTERGHRLRIISAWKADANDRDEYRGRSV
jgi:uncharacterized protein